MKSRRKVDSPGTFTMELRQGGRKKAEGLLGKNVLATNTEMSAALRKSHISDQTGKSLNSANTSLSAANVHFLHGTNVF